MYQAMFLLLFNSKSEIKPREIATKFQIQKEEVLNELQALVFNTCPILVKEPADGDLEDSNVLKVNFAILGKVEQNVVKVNNLKKKDEVIITDSETRCRHL